MTLIPQWMCESIVKSWRSWLVEDPSTAPLRQGVFAGEYWYQWKVGEVADHFQPDQEARSFCEATSPACSWQAAILHPEALEECRRATRRTPGGPKSFAGSKYHSLWDGKCGWPQCFEVVWHELNLTLPNRSLLCKKKEDHLWILKYSQMIVRTIWLI